jgi:hypothetical protein
VCNYQNFTYGVYDVSMYYILRSEAMRRTTQKYRKRSLLFLRSFALQISFFLKLNFKTADSVWDDEVCMCTIRRYEHSQQMCWQIGRAQGLPDFSWFKNTKTEKVYLMTTNYTKRPYIIPNGHTLYQTAIPILYLLNGHTLYQTAIPT